jgi:hypothetical protein
MVPPWEKLQKTTLPEGVFSYSFLILSIPDNSNRSIFDPSFHKFPQIVPKRIPKVLTISATIGSGEGSKNYLNLCDARNNFGCHFLPIS